MYGVVVNTWLGTKKFDKIKDVIVILFSERWNKIKSLYSTNQKIHSKFIKDSSV